MSKATIKRVAEHCGVSTGTVSRVLNGRPGVKPATRDLVYKAMKELNYQPDVAARELSFGQGITIGLSNLIGTKHLAPFHALFFRELMAVSHRKGLRLREVPAKSNGLPEWLPDVMVILGAHEDDPRIDFLNEHNVPTVVLGRDQGTVWVVCDDVDGGFQAGKHLIRLGHEKIVHITGYMHHQCSQDRYRGFCKALEENGIIHDKNLVIEGLWGSLASYRALRNFMESNAGKFTAIFATSDEMAIGAVAAIEDLGYSVPADYSVIGFDDLPDLECELTTIHQDVILLAETVAEKSVDLAEAKTVSPIILPVFLKPGSTTGKIQV